MVAEKPVAIDRGPFLYFALRRVLHALLGALLIVLLAGVAISTNTRYQEMLLGQELQACVREYQGELSFEDYSLLSSATVTGASESSR